MHNRALSCRVERFRRRCRWRLREAGNGIDVNDLDSGGFGGDRSCRGRSEYVKSHKCEACLPRTLSSLAASSTTLPETSFGVASTCSTVFSTTSLEPTSSSSAWLCSGIGACSGVAEPYCPSVNGVNNPLAVCADDIFSPGKNAACAEGIVRGGEGVDATESATGLAGSGTFGSAAIGGGNSSGEGTGAGEASV